LLQNYTVLVGDSFHEPCRRALLLGIIFVPFSGQVSHSAGQVPSYEYDLTLAISGLSASYQWARYQWAEN